LPLIYKKIKMLRIFGKNKHVKKGHISYDLGIMFGEDSQLFIA